MRSLLSHFLKPTHSQSFSRGITQNSSLALHTFQHHTLVRLPPTYAARRLLCTAQSIDLCTFHRVSDQALQEMMQKFEQLEQLEIPGFDVSEQDGVLELSLGEKGTYAINKQCQNRQIWWSSPVSGPKRYCYDSTLKAWKSTRDGHLMYDLLNQELSELLQIPFDIYTVASKPSVMTSESSRQQQ